MDLAELPDPSLDPKEPCGPESSEAVLPEGEAECASPESPGVGSALTDSTCVDPPEGAGLVGEAADSPMSPDSSPPYPIDPPSPESQGSDEVSPVIVMGVDQPLDLSCSSGSSTPSLASDDDDIGEEGEAQNVDEVQAFVAYQKLTMFRLGAITQTAPEITLPIIQEAEDVVKDRLCLQCSLGCGICGLKGLFQVTVPPGSLMSDHEAPGSPLLGMLYPENVYPPCPAYLSLMTVSGPPAVRQRFRLIHETEATMKLRLCSWRLHLVDGGYWVWNPVCMMSQDGMFHPVMSEVDPVFMVPDGK